MKQFSYRVYPKPKLHYIVADDLTDAIYRASKIHHVTKGNIIIDSSSNVVFQDFGGKRTFNKRERK